MNNLTLAGRPVYLSSFLTVSRTVRRTWRERLLSWPWRPWQRFRTEQVPDPQVYRVTATHRGIWPTAPGYYMHPATFERIRQSLLHG